MPRPRMPRLPRAPLTAALLLLAGCGTPEVAEHAAVPVPVAWRQPVAAEAVAYPAADWWRAFESPELERLVSLAEANNPDLAAAAYRIAQATAQARIARAALYPTVSAGTSASRRQPGEGSASNDFGVDLDASYEVDLWGQNRSAADAAIASRIATQYDREAVALSLVAEVATTYFQVLSLDDRLANAERVLAISRRVLALIEAQAAAGAVSGLELAQQRGTIASLEAQIPALRQQRDQSLDALAALVGVTPGQLNLAAGTLEGVGLPSIAPGLPSALLERRPDLRSAEAGLAAAAADTAAARAAMFPSIQLTGGAGLSSDALEHLFDPAGFLANLAAGLTQPIFDAGRLAAQRDVAAAREAELVENYRAAVIAAFQDVEDALAAVRYSAQVEEAQSEAAAEAQRAYDLAETQYRAGAVDFLTVLDAQRSLFQQQDSLRLARFDRLDAAVGLYRALGGGW